MKQKKYFILYFVILLIGANCASFGVKEKIAGKVIFFQLQPFMDTSIFLGEKKLTFDVIEIDKNIGQVKVEIPLDATTNKLVFKANGYNHKSIEINLLSDLEDQLISLDKQGLTHHFLKRIKTGLQPKSVRFIDDQRLAIPLLDDDGIEIVDIFSGKVSRISPPEKYKNKLGFVETIIIPEFQELWVSQMFANAVHIFDLKTLEYKSTVELTGRMAKILLYDATRDLVYCSNWMSEDISVIDRKTKKEIRKTEKIGLPRGLLLSKDGSELFIAQFAASNKDSAGGKLVVFSMETEKIKSVLGPSGNKRHIVSTDDGNKLYVSDMCCSKIEVYDPKNKTLIKSIPVFDKPNTIALSPDGKFLYVSCRGPNHPTEGYLKKGNILGQVYVIDTSTDEVKEFWEAGNQPTGLDVSPDNRTLAITDFLDHQVRLYTRDK